MENLTGKVVIITGSNSGVGEATAKLMAKEGATVVISARRMEPLLKVKEEIEAFGGKVLAVQTDISKVSDCENLVLKTIEAFGHIDGLVNNAGVLDTGLKAMDKFLDSDLEKVVNINTKGHMYMMRAALKYMKEEKKGSIVNVASVAGYTGCGGACYVASKAAMVGVTKHTAMRFATSNIRCNVLCPGNIETPMTSNIDHSSLDGEFFGEMMKHADIRSLPSCKAIEVAKVISFLISDDAKPLTGQVIVCDYGVNL